MRDDDRLVARHGARPPPTRARRARACRRSVDPARARSRGAVAEDEPLEERVRRQAVRAVEAGARRTRRWPRGPGWSCGPSRSVRDAAAHVVRRRDDRDGLRGDVDARSAGTRRRCWGSARARSAGFLSVMSRSTWSAPVRFISKSMARATMSRGASSPRGSCSFMNGVPSSEAEDRALAAERLA